MRSWKTIETRTHDRFASLNGRTILIHAGQRTDASEAAINNPYLTREQIIQNPDEVINGHILGSAYVYEFLALTEEHSARALIDCVSILRYGLFLDKIEVFKTPIPCKGEMGIWYYDLDAREKVKKPKQMLSNINSKTINL